MPPSGHAERAVGLTFRTALIALPVLVAITALWRTPAEAIALAALLSVTAALYLLVRAGHTAAALHGLVAALVLYGIAAIVAYGSIRSTGTLGFIVAIVMGGIFLGRATLLATLAACVGALGILTALEAGGTWPRPDFQVGPMHWMAYTVVLGAVALVTYSARMLVVDAAEAARASEQRVAALSRELEETARAVTHATGEDFFRALVEHLARVVGADLVLVGEAAGDRLRALALWRDGALAPGVESALSASPFDPALGAENLRVITDEVAVRYPEFSLAREGGMRGYLGAALRDLDGSVIGVLHACTRAPLGPLERAAPLMRIFAARAQAELLRLRRERVIVALNDSLESRVQERTAQLEAAQRELEAFTYALAHDLREPLVRIEGFARLLHEGAEAPLAERSREHVARVLANAGALHELIDQLRALSRLGRRALLRQPTDLSALAAETVERLRRAEPAREVTADIAPGLFAECDRALMRIVLDQLIGNAWKFTARRDGARIEVGSTANAGGPAFYVRDNGAGFDMRRAERLFRPFQRLHASGEFDGRGIGLATVQRILARHGGRAWAEGAAGAGATFYFML